MLPEESWPALEERVRRWHIEEPSVRVGAGCSAQEPTAAMQEVWASRTGRPGFGFMVRRRGEHLQAFGPVWLSPQHRDQLPPPHRLPAQPAWEPKGWSAWPGEAVVAQKMEMVRSLRLFTVLENFKYFSRCKIPWILVLEWILLTKLDLGTFYD